MSTNTGFSDTTCHITSLLLKFVLNSQGLSLPLFPTSSLNPKTERSTKLLQLMTFFLHVTVVWVAGKLVTDLINPFHPGDLK